MCSVREEGPAVTFIPAVSNPGFLHTFSNTPLFSSLYYLLGLFGLRGRFIHKHAAASNPPTLEKQTNSVSSCSDSRFRLSEKQSEHSYVRRLELCAAMASLQPRSCQLEYEGPQERSC